MKSKVMIIGSLLISMLASAFVNAGIRTTERYITNTTHVKQTLTLQFDKAFNLEGREQDLKHCQEIIWFAIIDKNGEETFLYKDSHFYSFELYPNEKVKMKLKMHCNRNEQAYLYLKISGDDFYYSTAGIIEIRVKRVPECNNCDGNNWKNRWATIDKNDYEELIYGSDNFAGAGNALDEYGIPSSYAKVSSSGSGAKKKFFIYPYWDE